MVYDWNGNELKIELDGGLTTIKCDEKNANSIIGIIGFDEKTANDIYKVGYIKWLRKLKLEKINGE